MESRYRNLLRVSLRKSIYLGFPFINFRAEGALSSSASLPPVEAMEESVPSELSANLKSARFSSAQATEVLSIGRRAAEGQRGASLGGG